MENTKMTDRLDICEKNKFDKAIPKIKDKAATLIKTDFQLKIDNKLKTIERTKMKYEIFLVSRPIPSATLN